MVSWVIEVFREALISRRRLKPLATDAKPAYAGSIVRVKRTVVRVGGLRNNCPRIYPPGSEPFASLRVRLGEGRMLRIRKPFAARLQSCSYNYSVLFIPMGEGRMLRIRKRFAARLRAEREKTQGCISRPNAVPFHQLPTVPTPIGGFAA